MEATKPSRQKHVVEQLNFGSKTAKRATWEAFEFTVVRPHHVEVTNASYGSEKDDHSYTVRVQERGGVVVPDECECKADEYNEEYDCKHKVALATVGGSTVLNAAVEFETSSSDQLRADGGCECDQYDFPCFDCYLSDRRELP